MTKTAVVDPGHGGHDSGAVANGLKEENLTLDISKRVKRKLESKYAGVNVRLTRTGDTYPSLQARCDLANRLNAAAFLSVHINSGGGTGFESYICAGAPSKTKDFQNKIHYHMAPVLKKYGLKDRGKKVDTQTRHGRLHVLRATEMSAVLVEVAFIDHPKDSKLLKDPAFLDDVAEALADGVADFVGLKKESGGASSPSKPSKPDKSSIAFPYPGFLIRRGSRGEYVRMIQWRLKGLDIDGIFGPLTEKRVKDFQRGQGITVDGIVGPVTWSEMWKSVPYPGYLIKRGSKGETVKIVQRKLGGLVIDGVFGPRTESAVKSFQKKHGLVVDGIVGPVTWNKLF